MNNYSKLLNFKGIRIFISFVIFLLLIYVNTLSAQDKTGISNGNGIYINDTSLGHVAVQTWEDGKKSAFSISFDDAYVTQYENARPILNEFGFKGTFYVIAGEMVEQPPYNWRYGSWPMFEELAREGHEIGSHTMTHPKLPLLDVGDEATPKTITYELYESQKIINERIPEQKCVTVAYPYCRHNADVDAVASNYYIAGRSCGHLADDQSLFGDEWYNLSGRDIAFSSPRNTVQDDMDELQSYEAAVQSEAFDQGKWSIFFAHEVMPFADIIKPENSGLYYPVSNEWLTSLCQWLYEKSNNNEVWVQTIGNITRYIKERDNFSFAVISASNSKIEIEPHDGLNDEIYNYPITVDVTIPNEWTDVIVQQGSDILPAKIMNDGTKQFVRTKIIPNGNTVTLNPASVNAYALSGKITYHNDVQTPIAGVTVTLSGNNNFTASATTDAEGNYFFENLQPGTYSVSVEKDTLWGGANASDALLAVKYFSNQAPLDSLQFKAADVNNSGSVNSTDALMIVKRYANLISQFNKPDWIFDPPKEVTIDNSDVIKNFEGIAAGDVNKSYIPLF